MVSWESSCLSPAYIARPQNMSDSQMGVCVSDLLAVKATLSALLGRQVGNVESNLEATAYLQDLAHWCNAFGCKE